ncbi:MAG: aspartate-semialdehyde dehydrogenase [Alkaliphilus sp.]
MALTIGIVGATGAVGQKMIEVLGERIISDVALRFFATKKSAGSFLEYRENKIIVEELTEEAMKEKFDYLLFAAGSSVSEKYAPIAKGAGNTIIDNSSYWRMEKNIPLVVPEVNTHVLEGYRGIIANPNCSTTQMLVAIAPLHRKYKIKRIVVSTYQAVSGSGQAAIEELENQLRDKNYPNVVYTKKIAGNCIPHIDVFYENGFSKEELKMVYETHKILEDNTIEINATAVRVPVFSGHSESVYIEFENEVVKEDITKILSESPGVIVIDDLSKNQYPTPLEIVDTDSTYVGRIRSDLYNKKAISLWIVSDNLRKGAATNAVQIIEAMENILKKENEYV